MPDGWHPYDANQNQGVEQLYQQHYVHAPPAAKRRRQLLNLPASSGWNYEIDFSNMVQRNTATGKERPIGRTTNGLPPNDGTTGVFGAPMVASIVSAVASGASSLAAALSASTTVATAVPPPSSNPFNFGTRTSAPAAAAAATTTAARTIHARKHGDTLTYTAPEVLHEVHLDEAKIFVDAPPPTSKRSAEEKKQADGAPSYATASHDDECAICLDNLWNASGDRVVSLKGCDHRFHYDCIHEALKKGGAKCPLCSKVVHQDQDGADLTSKGKSPSGTMQATTIPTPCSGYGHAQTIQISYNIPSGVQKSYHQNPGVHFSGARRVAYLPDTTEGKALLERMQYAFCHGLCFMVGTSLTTSQPNVVTWASVHHKTSMSGGTFGFPDNTYFTRCNREMDDIGVPSADTCRQWLANL